jgi:ABC-2 type transport system permease protein
LVLPLILMFIFGYGINLDVGRFKIAVIFNNDDPKCISLYTAFSNSRYFQATMGWDIRDFRGEITAGRLRGLVVIPSDFSQRIEQGQPPSVQIITDGTDPNTANFLRAYIQLTVLGWQANDLAENGLKEQELISLTTRAFYNAELNSRNALMPGSVSVILTITGVILTALVIAREWERGTMESLISTEASIHQIIISKFLTYITLAMVSLILCWAMGVYWYKVPFRGSFLVLILIGLVFLFTALGQGLLISTLTKNQYISAELALTSGFLPSFLLSGVIFEISSMPYLLRQFTKLIPARYFVSSLQAIFLAGDVWPIFMNSILSMAVIGILFFYITAKKTVKRVA